MHESIRSKTSVLAGLLAILGLTGHPGANAGPEPDGYEQLVALFHEWREFEKPPMKDGAPDYTAERMETVREAIGDWRERLRAIDVSGWPVSRQIDWHLLRAEINGLDFHARVLRPWARDPAFYQSVWTYQSDTPAHEGPTHHELVELWTYEFPLSAAEQRRLATDLAVIPPLLAQARENLTGNARDLWVSGIYNLRQQSDDLAALRERLADDTPAELTDAVNRAIESTDELVAWLEKKTPEKNGPSGIGIEDYTWHLQQVWYVPMTWEDEKRLLERELHRAWSSLALEEHRNRDLPALEPASSPEEYDRLAEASADRLMTFLKDEDILRVEPWMDTALREQLGQYVPPEHRNFFTIGSHLDPTPLFTHFYHWFDLARMDKEPHRSPLRQEPLRFNIFTSRAEGMATAFEELTMHAGLHDDHRRAREIVWILLAQRAARGLGSLEAHANHKTMTEAARFHARWTPRQWMNRDLEKVDSDDLAAEGDEGYADHMNLLAFEQQLYLRQPGYGTSYITGKYLIERLLAERSRQAGDEGRRYRLYDFFSEVNAAGVIPVSLLRWQLTGKDDQIRALMAES